MSILFSISLYVVSFLPLWVSVVFLDGLSILEHETNTATEWISICCIVIAVAVSIGVLYRELHGRGKDGARRQTIKAAKEEKALTAEFLLSYILPLFAFDFTVWRQVVLFLVFFCTLGFLCVRHNYYSVNVALEIAGYRFYRCRLENGDREQTERLVMSRRRLNELKGTDIYVANLNNEYGLDVGRADEGQGEGV